jgi:hypothetical protein
LFGAAGERLLEDSECGVGADVHDSANGVALHLRLVVVQQFGEIGQRLAPAELAHEVNGRPPHRGVLRILQSFDRPAADRSERQQNRRQPLAGARAFFHGKRFGERPHEHLAQ